MENRITRPRPPCGKFDVDFISGSSRERKSPALYRQGAISESNLPYYTQRDSNQQNKNFCSGANVEDNTRGLCFSQAKSIEPTSLGHQFHTQNVSVGSWLNHHGNSNFYVNRTENISNTSSHVPHQPLVYGGLFDSLNLQGGASVVESTWQTQVSPGEAYKSLPFLKSDGGHMRRDQVASSFEEIDNKCGASFEFRQSSNFSNNGGVNDFPSIGAASLGSSFRLEQIQNPISSQNGVQFCSSGTSAVTSGNISENGEQVQGDGFVKVEGTKKASDMKNLMHPLPESSPASTVESAQKKDQTHGSPVSDEKSKSQFGKPASILAEKLWDGSLQLSSSVVVSAVAFFKSGEKLLDTNWSDSVEVKGKVRLEAFEKYIQDLPRSRSRGLMVISLCWKEGSSETGRAGMKEVAKGYKKGEKVGRAPISPGIDLYICPRSDAIITILAKYGFFKGMAAVEDNPDSMIGCVVWRKNQASLNSVAKKPESKSNSLSEKPLNSPSLSPLQQASEPEKHLSVPQPAQECAERSVSESKKQIETNSTVSGPEQPKKSVELQKPISFPSDKPKETTTSFYDDDLPEFDFRTACGISQTNVILAKGSRNTDTSLLPGTPNLLATSVSGQRSDHSKLPSTANEGMPVLKKICDREPQILVLPNVGERSSVQNKVTTTPVNATVFSHPKNIFDDDDDMPEWCPPERSLAEITSRSTTFPSELQSPPFQTSVRGPPRSLSFSPTTNATHPPFSSQGFPPKAPQPRPFKRGPISSRGSNSDSILGPPPSFDTKVPYLAEKRRRPC